MNTEITEVEIDSIITKRRMRRDNGDLSRLERSIQKLGILHPIIVDRQGVLVSGGRRLEAARNVGLTTVPVMKLDVENDSMLAVDIQSDENLCRRPLSSDEFEAQIERKKSIMEGRTPNSEGGFFSWLKHVFSG